MACVTTPVAVSVKECSTSHIANYLRAAKIKLKLSCSTCKAKSSFWSCKTLDPGAGPGFPQTLLRQASCVPHKRSESFRAWR